MYLKDFKNFVDENGIKSPYWHYKTFKMFYLENPNNLIYEGFNFKYHFPKLLKVI